MKKKSLFISGFFHPRLLLSLLLCSLGTVLAAVSFAPLPGRVASLKVQPSPGEAVELARYMPVLGGDPDDLDRMELEWNNRVTYPTGLFNPEWLRLAAAQDRLVARAVPAGRPAGNLKRRNAPLTLDPNNFTALGPKPERMTGCSGCYDYGTTEGRVNDIVVDPATTTNGFIVAYAASDGGGVWKTINCCSSTTCLDARDGRSTARHDRDRHDHD